MANENFDGLPCTRNDCELEVVNKYGTTLGRMETFTRDGERIKTVDPNTYTATVRCGTCDKSWRRIIKDGQKTVWSGP